jgi:hypothetical protein
MAEVKHSGKSMAQRDADRLRPSNDHNTASHHHTSGTGERRTSVTIHHSGQNAAHGHMPMDPLDPKDGEQ